MPWNIKTITHDNQKNSCDVGSERKPVALFLCRYMFDPRKKPHVKIQPPFIRPDLSERQITIKLSDNGIHSSIISSKVSSSPPHKWPTFIYWGLRTHGHNSSLKLKLGKTTGILPETSQIAEKWLCLLLTHCVSSEEKNLLFPFRVRLQIQLICHVHVWSFSANFC